MRIGVDGTCWQNTRGFGRHARELLSKLITLDEEDRFTLFVDSTRNLESVPAQAEVRVVRSLLPTVVAASADGHRALRDMWQMSRAMSDRTLDVLLFPGIYSYVPVFSRAKKLVMIHDVIPETYPQFMLPTVRSRWLWKIKVAFGWWQATEIITVSEYSRRMILRHFKPSRKKVFVVGEASNPAFRVLADRRLSPKLEAFGVDSRHRAVVYVGGFGPHKNLERLITTFAKLASEVNFSDIRLIMVGEYEKEVFLSCYRVIRRLADDLGVADRVVFTGYLSDEELVVLLNCATVLVLPSVMEGFGLPAIEAAACGCPVIATLESPLPELLGEAGIFIDPSKGEELERALARVLESPCLRRQMSAAGLLAAKRLTWDAAARQMMSIIRRVVES